MILDRICQHFRCIGISPRESARFTSLIRKWVTNSGPEWTVERLKRLRSSFMDSLESGDDYVVPEGWASRVNRKGKKVFCDDLIHRLFTDIGDRKKIAKTEMFLRAYQGITLPSGSVSVKQLDKFIAAVTTDGVDKSRWENQPQFTLRMETPSKQSISQIAAIGGKASTLPEFLGDMKSSPTVKVNSKGDFVMKSFKRNLVSAEAGDFVEQVKFDKDLHMLWVEYPFETRAALGLPLNCGMSRAEEHFDLPIGKVLALQEPGCKVRWVANPTLAIQSLGEPAKVKLQQYLKVMYPAVVAVDDQDAGRQLVVKWLQEKRTVFSYDLTSFTDRFPYSFQQSVLRKLMYMGVLSRFDVEVFDIVAKKAWVSEPTGGDLIRWKVGQPLGFGPSFPLATLSHAVILDGLCFQHNKPREYCIVGDDVVIPDEQVAIAYTLAMKDLGVEINESKTMISSRYVEFLGKLVGNDGYHDTLKVRPIDEIESLLSAMDVYGPRCLRYLRAGWQRNYHTLAYLPRNIGGLGWVPSGATLEDQTSMYDYEKLVPWMIKSAIGAYIGPRATYAASNRSLNVAFNHADRNPVYEFDETFGIRNALPGLDYKGVRPHLFINAVSHFGVKPNLSKLESDYLSLSIKGESDLTNPVADVNTFKYVFDTAIDHAFRTHEASAPTVNTLPEVPEMEFVLGMPADAHLLLNTSGQISMLESDYLSPNKSKGFQNEPSKFASFRKARRLQGVFSEEGSDSIKWNELCEEQEPQDDEHRFPSERGG